MIVVKVEIWPGGNKKQREVITEMKIGNTADHPMRPMYGNYFAEIKGVKARIEHHDRRENIWHLIRKSIDEILEKYKW